MIRITGWIVIASLLMHACGSPDTAGKAPVIADTSQFYATAHFFKSQVDYISLLKTSFYLYKNENGKADSIQIDEPAFRQLAKQFLSKDISDPDMKQHYRESLFQDAGTQSYTLSYSAIDDLVNIRGLDVLLDEQTQQVKRIFIRSQSIKGDTTIQEQYNWNAFKEFQINKSMRTPGGYQSTILTRVHWKTDGKKD